MRVYICRKKRFIDSHLLNKVKFSDMQREFLEFVSCVIIFEVYTSYLDRLNTVPGSFSNCPAPISQFRPRRHSAHAGSHRRPDQPGVTHYTVSASFSLSCRSIEIEDTCSRRRRRRKRPLSCPAELQTQKLPLRETIPDVGAAQSHLLSRFFLS